MSYGFRHRVGKQEVLAKDDIRLLLECVRIAAEDGSLAVYATGTRIDLLIGKLKRMEKQ